jgi:hypothetical protein
VGVTLEIPFFRPARPHRFSRRFKILVAALYVAVVPIASVILHLIRVNYAKIAGTNAGFDSDRDTAKFLVTFALLYLVAPVLLLAIAGVLKLLLIVIEWFEARPPPAAR